MWKLNNKRGYAMFKLKLYFLFLGLSWIQMSSFAINQLIIKYKPSSDQVKMITAGQLDIKQLNRHLMQPLSNLQIDQLTKVAGMKVRDSHAIGNGAHVILLEKDVTQEQLNRIIEKIQTDQSVQYVVEDKTATPTAALNPTRQWNMMKTFDYKGAIWYGDNFEQAWNLINPLEIKPGENVVIAVLDTGYTPHPNILSNLLPLNPESKPEEYKYGYQFISDCRRSGDCAANTTDSQAQGKSPREDALDKGDYVTQENIDNDKNDFFRKNCIKPYNSRWHGSGMIGMIAANGYIENSPIYRIAGGAWGAKVVPVRIGGKCGVSMSDVFNGALWAAGQHATIRNSNPAQVLNLSLGGRGLCDKFSQDVIDQINNETNGIIIVSAGNDTIDVSNQRPANCNGVISVSAKTVENKLAPYSNSGKTTITASGGSIRPPCDTTGCSILTVAWNSQQEYRFTDGGKSFVREGTSSSAAHVSAAVADIISILKYYGKSYDLKQIVHILRETSGRLERPYHCNVGGCVSGHTLNVGEAIKSILPDRLIGYAFLGSSTYIINKPHNELVRCDVKQKNNQMVIDTSKEACVFYKLDGGGYAVSIFALRLSKSNNYLLVGTSLGIYVCHIKNFVMNPI